MCEIITLILRECVNVNILCEQANISTGFYYAKMWGPSLHMLVTDELLLLK